MNSILSNLFISWFLSLCLFSHAQAHGKYKGNHRAESRRATPTKRQLIRNQLQAAIISYFMLCSHFTVAKTHQQRQTKFSFRFAIMFLLQIKSLTICESQNRYNKQLIRVKYIANH